MQGGTAASQEAPFSISTLWTSQKALKQQFLNPEQLWDL
jgi:hypothetical protein